MTNNRAMPRRALGRIGARSAKGVVPIGASGDLTGEAFWHNLGAGRSNYTGRSVNSHAMLETSAVYSAIRLISESAAALPLHLYRITPKGDEKAVEHPLYRKLNKLPHKYTTRATFVESLVVSMCIWNQVYIKVNRFGTRVVSLQALPQPWVRPIVSKNGRDLSYEVTEMGSAREYKFGEIIPIRGFGLAADLEGINVAGMHRNAIGLAMAAEEYGSRFFSNGARPGGVFMYDRVLNPEQRERIREQLQENHVGTENASKPMVLEAGMKWQPMQTQNNDSQFIETRRNQVLEIARIFRVPPHKLYEMDKATYNNVEQENRAFMIDTLNPYLDRIELALDCFLLDPADQDIYFTKFNIEGRLRADTKTRAETLKEFVLTGLMTQNEARAKENLPPEPGGDVLLRPLNMASSQVHDQILLAGKSTTTTTEGSTDG